jgi:hypothetical protein
VLGAADDELGELSSDALQATVDKAVNPTIASTE